MPLELMMTLLLFSADPADPIVVEPALVIVGEQREAPAQELGVLADVAVKEMQSVERGQLIARLDDRDARLEVERARANLAAAQRKASTEIKIEYARKELELAEVELRSIAEANLRFNRSKPPIEVERKQLEVEKMRLGIKQAEHDHAVFEDEYKVAESELAIAQRRLDRHTLISTLDGVVARIYRRQGEWVQPGEAVLRIVPLDRLQVTGFVDASLLSQTQIGVPVRFDSADFKGQSFSGELIFIDTVVNPADGKIRVKAEVDNTERKLKPGVRGVLVIERTD